jgi:hypothetical protein
MSFYESPVFVDALLVGIYVLLTDNREDAMHFALACLGMYVVMMAATLSLRH